MEVIEGLTDEVGSLRDDLVTAGRTISHLQQQLDDASQPQRTLVRTKEKGRPYSLDFEAHARNLMATGMSAHCCRESVRLNAKFFLPASSFEAVEVSVVRWFRHQREGIGVESWTYAMVALAGAEEVLQHGHDETSIDRQPTFNQWILIKDADGELDVVTVEAGGILVGSKATEIAAHIKKTWERGERAIAILR